MAIQTHKITETPDAFIVNPDQSGSTMDSSETMGTGLRYPGFAESGRESRAAPERCALDTLGRLVRLRQAYGLENVRAKAR